jgi:hypothetical protein
MYQILVGCTEQTKVKIVILCGCIEAEQPSLLLICRRNHDIFNLLNFTEFAYLAVRMTKERPSNTMLRNEQYPICFYNMDY